jgi:hypothetical protein
MPTDNHGKDHASIESKINAKEIKKQFFVEN